MRERHKKHEPHIGDRRFRVHECLQGKRKDYCCPPTELLSANARAPGKNRQCRERCCDCRWKSRCKIVFAKDFVACDLRPIGEGRLIETKLIVKVRNDVVASFYHLPRRFGKARLIAVDQRQSPSAGDVKQHGAGKQEGVIADCGFQTSD